MYVCICCRCVCMHVCVVYVCGGMYVHKQGYEHRHHHYRQLDTRTRTHARTHTHTHTHAHAQAWTHVCTHALSRLLEGVSPYTCPYMCPYMYDYVRPYRKRIVKITCNIPSTDRLHREWERDRERKRGARASRLVGGFYFLGGAGGAADQRGDELGLVLSVGICRCHH